MIKITLEIEGMRCHMCEAHMNDAVNKQLKVKKVTSSHADNETVIVAENDVDDAKLNDIVTNVGFVLKGIKREPCDKKGIFSVFKGK